MKIRFAASGEGLQAEVPGMQKYAFRGGAALNIMDAVKHKHGRGLIPTVATAIAHAGEGRERGRRMERRHAWMRVG